MLIRPTVEADLDRVRTVTMTEPVGWIPPERYRDELAQRMYRPEWTWIAEEGDRIRARAVWWGRPDSARPLALDCLWVDETISETAILAAQVLEAGHRWFAGQGAVSPPAFNITLANHWHADPLAEAAMAWRRAAAAAVGLGHEVERLRFEWTPPAGVPEPTGRLTFRSEPDDETMLEVFRRIAVGSLDDETGKNVARLGLDRAVREELQYYREAPGERSWWRTAHTGDGALAGLAIPSATRYHRNVGYLGVVPERRGQGYVDEILGEITRIHAAADAEKVTATTDLGNAPMAAAFHRAGYRNTETRVIFSAP